MPVSAAPLEDTTLNKAPVEDTTAAQPSLLARGQHELALMHKRRSYISSPETQQRIVRQFMLVLGVGMALGLANAYVIASFSHLEIVVLPEASRLEMWLALTYMASMALASFGVVLLLAVFYSHRVGGPVFKIVGALQRLADGDVRGRVRLRETDLLDDVALAVNEVGMSFGRTVREIDASVTALRASGGLGAAGEPHVAEIERVLRRYGAVLPSVQEESTAVGAPREAMTFGRGSA